MAAAPVPEPFVIHASDEQLADLRRRLLAARIVPNEIEDAGRDPNGSWAYGTDRTVLRDYVAHWQNNYDWRKHEASLNTLPHFTVPVKGLRMHFIHQRSQAAGAIPLLLIHGWPGSVVEFLKVIPSLVSAGFHVVAPSIPGYGWSEAPRKRGAHVGFMGDHMHQLMLQLGYQHYVAQGGDWGAAISSSIAGRYPQHCVALHINLLPAVPPRDWYGLLKLVAGLLFMSAEERSSFSSTMYFMKYESAYQQIQGTKPQSLAYGLNDSPMGLLAWILEKFQTWSDCKGGNPEDAGPSKDEILTNVMVYWLTESIASSFRIYYETLGHNPQAASGMLPATPLGLVSYVAVPTGVLWANDIYKLPRSMANLAYNVKHWTACDKGGHFFAFEQPERFVAEVCHFFKEVIDFEQCKAQPPKAGQGRPLEPGKYALMALVCAALGKYVVGKLGQRSRL